MSCARRTAASTLRVTAGLQSEFRAVAETTLPCSFAATSTTSEQADFNSLEDNETFGERCQETPPPIDTLFGDGGAAGAGAPQVQVVQLERVPVLL